MQTETNRMEFQGRLLDEWRAQLADQNTTVRLLAAEAIGEIGPAAVPALIDMLHHEDVNVRYWAAKGLGKVGKDGKPAAEALRAALQGDASGTVRGMAAEALCRIGDREAGLDGLIAALKDPNPSVQLRAGNYLRLLGPEAKRALPALQELGQSTKDEYVTRIAAAASEAIQG
jgi:HEAT repeat protein